MVCNLSVALRLYRRFRAGTEVSGSFNVEGALVAEIMGWSAADIVCVMGNSPGPLELLPTKTFRRDGLSSFGIQMETKSKPCHRCRYRIPMTKFTQPA